MVSPAGRSNSIVQPLTGADPELVTLTLTWWPLPQSPAEVKVAPIAPAANAGWVTTSAESSVTTAASAVVIRTGRRRPVGVELECRAKAIVRFPCPSSERRICKEFVLLVDSDANNRHWVKSTGRVGERRSSSAVQSRRKTQSVTCVDALPRGGRKVSWTARERPTKKAWPR